MKQPDLFGLWVYLESAPLFWLTTTLIAYQVTNWLFIRFHRSPLLNPIPWSIAIIAVMLEVTDTDYKTYFSGAQFIHFLLGPATVALAVPLYRQFGRVVRSAGALGVALPLGSCIAAVVAVVLAGVLGADKATLISLAPKSVTTPIAMGVSQSLGGIASLTAVFVVITGVIGAIVAGPIFKIIRITDQRAIGFALGLSAHGLGTARAFQYGETAGAFAGMAIGLNGLMTAIILPIILPMLLALF